VSNKVVYVIFRTNGIPCYVGKGGPRRVEEHFAVRPAHSRHRGYTNRHLKAIIRQAGGLLPFVIVREGLSEIEANAVEVALIAAIGRADLGRGPLVNFTDGGEGASGMKKSPEAIERTAAARRGTKHTDESRLKMSLALQGREPSFVGKKHSDATKQRMGIVQTGIVWWSTSDGKSYRARQPRSMEDVRGRHDVNAKTTFPIWSVGTSWWTSPKGEVYIAVEPRSQDDVRGRGEFNPVAGKFWWCTPDGAQYRASKPKSSSDVRGRRYLSNLEGE
jgi:hypothetical protein